MEITEIRVKPAEELNERLLAFCTIVFDDCFVIRDIKLIRGGSGVFVAMPSKTLMDKCSRCSEKNHLRAKFCNWCGASLPEDRTEKDPSGREKLFADVAHPTTRQFRSVVEETIIEAYRRELRRLARPEPEFLKTHSTEGAETEFSEED